MAPDSNGQGSKGVDVNVCGVADEAGGGTVSVLGYSSAFLHPSKILTCDCMPCFCKEVAPESNGQGRGYEWERRQGRDRGIW